MKDDGEIRGLIKSGLKKKKISMRKLSAQAGMDPATLSRIMNGKQKAKPEQLRILAELLDYPVLQFYHAAGYGVEWPLAAPSANLHAMTVQWKQWLPKGDTGRQNELVLAKVEEALNVYEQLAGTDEIFQRIHEDFPKKLAEVKGKGPFIEQLQALYGLFCGETLSREQRAVAGSGLLYFIRSADIIPDDELPLGYLDDALAVQLVLNRLNTMGELN